MPSTPPPSTPPPPPARCGRPRPRRLIGAVWPPRSPLTDGGPPPGLTDAGPPPDLAALFAIDGRLLSLRPLGRGHIHHTLLGEYRQDDGQVVRYVHQRLNTTVFADVELLMDNLVRVTARLGAVAGPTRPAVRLRPAAGGRFWATDAAGGHWRTLDFIEGARTHARFPGPAAAADGATVAARLVEELDGLAPPLPEVLPGFHDVARRLLVLAAARADDAQGRAGGCSAEIEAVLAHRGLAATVAGARRAGLLPERTVHNDAKVDNLLVDATTGAALCLVDLDTVGPGTVLFDVGDLVRSGAVTGPEDAPDALAVDHRVVTAVIDAYAHAGAGFLTTAEIDLLPHAGPLMALEAAARFLTDHLQGDVYFHVDDPGHNLRRARNQIRVLELLLAA